MIQFFGFRTSLHAELVISRQTFSSTSVTKELISDSSDLKDS